MSCTIYGGTTRNGIIIQDMVDDNRDLGFWNDRFNGYFARFAQSIAENDENFSTAGPAIAIFSEDDPYEPIWGVRLPGTFADYTDGWSMSDKFMNHLNMLWNDFGYHLATA